MQLTLYRDLAQSHVPNMWVLKIFCSGYIAVMNDDDGYGQNAFCVLVLIL